MYCQVIHTQTVSDCQQLCLLCTELSDVRAGSGRSGSSTSCVELLLYMSVCAAVLSMT